ncbi:MAG: hypothetical protein LBP79_05500 [Clostridiales bacterium]|jgi:hypothetical protein|nr:hypothetical protein [Clostridiales bacterium]
MKKKVTLFALVVSLVVMITALSSCSLIVSGKYSGGASTAEESAEVLDGVFEFKITGKMTYKGQSKMTGDDGLIVKDVEFSGKYTVEAGKNGIYNVYIDGKDQDGNNTFYGIKTYFEGNKQILVYWDGDDTSAYVYKK